MIASTFFSTRWIINRGYTGHEHLDAFGIINMNGRVYDPLTAMFFSPDPALDGRDWLSYNRYGYCLGNPFKYSDPSGNNPFLIAAALGGFINVGIQLLSGNIHNVGQFFGAFGVGALAGLTGAWAGGAVSAALGGSVGAIGGGAVGAAGGAAGGLIGGAGNAWVSGASFGDGLLAGIKGAGMGALAGGIIGGISGGISALNHGGDFWTGEGAKYDALSANASSKSGDGGPVEYSNESANKFSNENFVRPKGLNELHADGSYPEGYKVENEIMYNDGNHAIDGVTIYNGISDRTSNVYFAKSAFVSKSNLFLVMGHEYIHVNLNYGGYSRNIWKNSQEKIAYRWSIDQGNQWGMDVSTYQRIYNAKYWNAPSIPNTLTPIKIIRPW